MISKNLHDYFKMYDEMKNKEKSLSNECAFIEKNELSIDLLKFSWVLSFPFLLSITLFFYEINYDITSLVQNVVVLQILLGLVYTFSFFFYIYKVKFTTLSDDFEMLISFSLTTSVLLLLSSLIQSIGFLVFIYVFFLLLTIQFSFIFSIFYRHRTKGYSKESESIKKKNEEKEINFLLMEKELTKRTSEIINSPSCMKAVINKTLISSYKYEEDFNYEHEEIASLRLISILEEATRDEKTNSENKAKKEALFLNAFGEDLTSKNKIELKTLITK